MGFLPQLEPQKTTQQVTNVFKGYRNAKEIAEGEFLSIINLSGDDYPMLSSRKPRGMPTDTSLTQIDPATGLITKDALYFIQNGNLLKYSPSARSTTLVTSEKTFTGTEERTFVSMGAYLLIFPDKWYINTMDAENCGDIEAKASISPSTLYPVSYTICSRTGDEYGDVPTVMPEDPQSGDFWIDTSGTPHLLKMWNAIDQTWVTVPTVYTKISYPGIGANFKEMDGVKLSGISYSGSTPGVAEQYEALNGTKILYVVAEDYIVIVGLVDENYQQETGSVVAAREIPDMDFVVEAQNRLWGCKYGIGDDGKPINELYCCKLGDFRNWNSFLGISTDSWAASIGSDGPWTGAITYNRYPTFFKENVMHRVSISAAGAHQVVETKLPGVQRGCDKSLAIVGSTLFYRGIAGIYAYDGSPPVLVSQALGEGKFYFASAGGHGDKYYVSMATTTAETGRTFKLYIYDTAKNIWYIEDGTAGYPSLFAECDGELYFTVRHIVEGTEYLRLVGETGLIGYETVEQKYVTRFNIRMILPVGSYMDVYIQYDSNGTWRHCGHINGTGTRTFTLPIRPRRCDHFQIKIMGKGTVKVYSFAKIHETGSDVS